MYLWNKALKTPYKVERIYSYQHRHEGKPLAEP